MYLLVNIKPKGYRTLLKCEVAKNQTVILPTLIYDGVDAEFDEDRIPADQSIRQSK